MLGLRRRRSCSFSLRFRTRRKRRNEVPQSNTSWVSVLNLVESSVLSVIYPALGPDKFKVGKTGKSKTDMIKTRPTQFDEQLLFVEEVKTAKTASKAGYAAVGTGEWTPNPRSTRLPVEAIIIGLASAITVCALAFVISWQVAFIVLAAIGIKSYHSNSARSC